MDDIATTIAAFFLLVVALFLGFVLGLNSIERQCKNFGAFVIEKDKYTCTPMETDGTP